MRIFELLQETVLVTCVRTLAWGCLLTRVGLVLCRAGAITAAVGGLVMPLENLAVAAGPIAVAGATPPLWIAVPDVRLSDRGTLAGQVVDGDGRPLTGISVAVYRSGHAVGSDASRSDGSFAVAGMRGGVHQLVIGGQGYPARLWTAAAAPPAAISRVMLVRDRGTVRGQLEPGPVGRGYERLKYWLADPLVVAGIVAAAVAIPVVVHNANIDRDSGS
jgi:hypothetical protein